MSLEISLAAAPTQPAAAQNLSIQLGACRLNLDFAAAEKLSQELSQLLGSAWQEPANFWPEQEAKLEQLKFVLPILEEQTSSQLHQALQNLNLAEQLALLRFCQNKQPSLAQHILTSQRLGQEQNQQQQAFAESVYSAPASSLVEVVSGLKQLAEIFAPAAASAEKSTDEAAQTSLPKTAKPNLSALAISYLSNFNQLGSTEFKQALRQLNTEEMGYLFSAVKMLQVKSLEQRLEEILPERIFTAFNTKCANQISSINLRALLTKLDSCQE